MPFPIVYIAGSFPARSETFVYREVRELRRRGWDVTTLSLNDSKERGLTEFADLEKCNTIVYGTGGGATIGAMMAEIFTHPIRSMRTFFTAIGDAIAPNEPTRLRDRIKVAGQGLAAIRAAGRIAGAGCAH